MRCLLPAIGLCLAWFTVGSALGAEPARLVWHTDFQTAQQESAASGLPLLVHFYGTNCPPCRTMEAEVFQSAEFQKAMAGGCVVVKLESRKDRALLDQFGIRSIPADLVLSPTGKVLWRHEGYQSGDQRLYIAAVSRHRGQPSIATVPKEAPNPRGAIADETSQPPRFESLPVKSESIERQPSQRRSDVPVAKRTPGPGPEKPAPYSRSRTADRPAVAAAEQPSSQRPEAPRFEEEEQQQQQQQQWTAAKPKSKSRSPAPVRSAGEAAEQADERVTKPVAKSEWALDGYSPVRLKEAGQWVAGQDEFTAEHDGLTYRFVDAGERDRFVRSPEQFAVQEGGRDVVLWDEVRKPLSGSTRFAAYYNGQLYLFFSRESRAQFKKNPARYARGRQAAWQIHPSDWGVRLLE